MLSRSGASGGIGGFHWFLLVLNDFFVVVCDLYSFFFFGGGGNIDYLKSVFYHACSQTRYDKSPGEDFPKDCQGKCATCLQETFRLL